MEPVEVHGWVEQASVADKVRSVIKLPPQAIVQIKLALLRNDLVAGYVALIALVAQGTAIKTVVSLLSKYISVGAVVSVTNNQFSRH